MMLEQRNDRQFSVPTYFAPLALRRSFQPGLYL